MAILTSYDLNGKKDSFANWISNLSPVDTYFVSTTRKEKVTNTLFQWQTDALAKPAVNAFKEAEPAEASRLEPTKVLNNVTQILRKAVEVSDTADAISNWGRGKELAYQMEKAGKEIKRDLEVALLKYDTVAVSGTEGDIQNDGTGNGGTARKTASFGKLVAPIGAANAGAEDTTSTDTGDYPTQKDKDTGAVVHKKTGKAITAADAVTEKQVFDITYNLYLAGSDADTIMFHPRWASFFSSLMETGSGRVKVIENMETSLNKFVGTVIDPLGQQFRLIPNRYMPEDAIYFFNPRDWTQMVLREPQKVQLAKKGSSERYMIEMELGLRHKNPYASGILKISA